MNICSPFSIMLSCKTYSAAIKTGILFIVCLNGIEQKKPDPYCFSILLSITCILHKHFLANQIGIDKPASWRSFTNLDLKKELYNKV